MKSDQVRQVFIDFFKSKGHTFAAASPVVPQNDPTIMFTNAGMNQFKDVFLGQGTRPYTRAVNSQPCIRVSGKHNDLEEVGADTYHQTLFEMLGNWSFGDYYKTEAIQWAWELVTGPYGLPKDRLYASIYETDDESGDIWQKVTDINPAHILKFGNKDNFWEMGATGPCGPCSEIHLDRGPDYCDHSGGADHICKVNGDCARYIELWNLVFIQYNRNEDGSLTDLPHKHVDTGAGLERITAYLQGTASNYETDLFQPIIAKIVEISGVPYSADATGMPHRVLADHVRTLAFAIGDNVRPANDGRGYVLRRLLRRGLRYAQKLGVKRPIIYHLVDPVVAVMGLHYPTLAQRQDYIKTVILSEEESFLKTLETGTRQFENLVSELQTQNTSVVPGAEAFKLYDTYGFPLDLTQLMASEHHLKVDEDGFKTAMEKQREQSRANAKCHDAAFGGDVPKGGEARIVKSEADILGMSRHHTATHLLHEALRQVLGTHVEQAGSLVDIDRLRFDFTHPKAISESEMNQVLSIVKEKIEADIPVEAFQKPIAEAKAMGAMALFGEKYDDIVRCIQIGDFSLELCGGHHVPNTGVIEEVLITWEGAISAGTRRIEAISGNQNIANYQDKLIEKINETARQKLENSEKLINEIRRFDTSATIPQPPISPTENNPEAAEKWLDDVTNFVRDLEKNLGKLKSQRAGENISELLVDIIEVKPEVRVLAKQFDGYDVGTLKQLADNLVNSAPNLIVILAGIDGDRANWVVKVAAPFVSKGISAGAIIQKLCAVSGGRGGGKPEMAQAGGATASKVSEVLSTISDFV